jgi:ribose transport system permease protein
LILVLSLLLTLLVPVIGRYLYFISPFAAFVVLGCVVVGIMLYVSTRDTYAVAAVADGALKPDADVMSRYLLLPIMQSGSGPVLPDLTPLQKTVFGFAAVLAVLTFTVRVIVAEAVSVRLGAFIYVFVSALILLLFVIVGEQSHVPGISATGQSSGSVP